MDLQQNRPSDSHFSPRESRPEVDNTPKKSSSRRGIIIAVSALVIVALGVGVLLYSGISRSRDDEARAEADEAAARQIELQEQLAASELENADKELTQLEGQRDLVINDTLKARLTEQYNSARLQIEKLQRELKNTKNRSQAEIDKLRGEIETLRKLLKHYLEEIARLNQENEMLRAENAQIKDENQQLSSQVATTTAQNQVLSERMTLAEKLNVTGVSLTALNSKGKTEKKVKKARQLMVTFTIPQNNSTPVGEKTIYVRVISPEGNLLGGAGAFSFEGASVACSAKKIVEYEGAEIANIHIYCDVSSSLTAGEYTVELFADNYRLARRSFNLK